MLYALTLQGHTTCLALLCVLGSTAMPEQRLISGHTGDCLQTIAISHRPQTSRHPGSHRAAKEKHGSDGLTGFACMTADAVSAIKAWMLRACLTTVDAAARFMPAGLR